MTSKALQSVPALRTSDKRVATLSFKESLSAFEQRIANESVQRGNSLREARLDRDALVAEFLERLGFLQNSPFNGDTARAFVVSNPQRFSTALRKYQEFHGLDPTGQLDEFTLAAIRQPRCGCRDLRPTARAARCSWSKQVLTYEFLNDSSDFDPPDQGPQDVRDAIIRAFTTWEALGKIRFEPGTPGAADIVIEWRVGLENTFNILGDVVAAADFPGDCAFMGGGPKRPILFDDNQDWVIGQAPGTFDLESIAVHEIGHILGLEHLSDKNTIMYSTFSAGQVPKRNLTAADIAAYQALYP